MIDPFIIQNRFIDIENNYKLIYLIVIMIIIAILIIIIYAFIPHISIDYDKPVNETKNLISYTYY
jgi:competence protein ComGC